MSDGTAAAANLLALGLAVLFGLAGVIHLAGPAPVRAAYRNWQFPRGFHYVAGIAQSLAALFLAVPETRIWGGILAAMILFVTVVSLLNRRKYLYAVPAILVMMAIAPAMAGL
ncbi:MAG TPA: DoxX family protein [Bryobacteraceae bacterium]|jgi:hypothetical protein|nr:DoxX family protein [Bryobacteraceae bacterium]